jgi:hypothetical protein
MYNRFVQQGREVRPGQRAVVLMRGPGGEFEIPFDEAVFGGPARSESRAYWIKRERAEPVLVPEIGRFGERHKLTGEQGWEDVPAHSAMEGLLLPRPAGKDYRLLKVVTQAATADQIAGLGNDRVPIFTILAEPALPPLPAPDEAPSPRVKRPPPDQLEFPV